jgi:hypothetical protein
MGYSKLGGEEKVRGTRKPDKRYIYIVVKIVADGRVNVTCTVDYTCITYKRMADSRAITTMVETCRSAQIAAFLNHVQKPRRVARSSFFGYISKTTFLFGSLFVCVCVCVCMLSS